MRRYFSAILLTAGVVGAQGTFPAPAFAQVTSNQTFGASGAPAGVALNDRGLRNLFADTIDDFRRLPSVESATILSVGAIVATAGSRFDNQATNMLSASPSLSTAFHSGETLGGARAQAVAAVTTYAIGRITRHPRATAIGADLVSAQIVTQTTTAAIKMAVGRTRPDGTDFSFPSGHSSTSFATATVLQRHLGWKVGIPAYGVAAYVATSRIQVKRHFLSDVAFGAALGIVAGRTVTIGQGETRFAVTPTAVPGGGAVSFALLSSK
jgi:membrane-associated phospholipid phosphatase